MAGLRPPGTAWVRIALTWLLAVSALSACTGQGPTTADGQQDGSPGGPRWLRPLKPLAHQPPVPAGAPRSRVPAVNYELTSPGTGDDFPDDGVPGDQGEVFQRGGASWYGFQFHNRKTANGERFDMGAFTAAHKTLPFGTKVCVRSLVNGREVLVRINDRGPYASGRVIDLSRAAAEAIGLLDIGIKQVALTVVDKDGGRCAGKGVNDGSTDDAVANGSADSEDEDKSPASSSSKRGKPSIKRPAKAKSGR